ncbi:MAG TPA: lysozyme, partial [Caulobacteraceae bacterium]|nr:lysozyme [Caulobacteraceae bacterium]
RRKAARLPEGRWTLGYGHTLTAREGAEVSQEDAEALLLYDLIEISHAVNELTWTPLNQNQFDALCAFVFNIGVDNYRTSMVLRRLNQGAPLQAAACMELWRTAEVQGERMVVDALVRRRAAEKLLFLTPPDGWVVASTPILRPRLDTDAVDEYALQSPPPFPNPGIEPEDPEAAPDASASERAAAALSARLEKIFPQAEPAGPALRLTPAPEFELPPAPAPPEPEPPQEGPTLFDVAIPSANAAEPMALHKVSSGGRSPHWLSALAPVLLAMAGMALAAGALFWGLYARKAGGVDPQVVSWLGGPAGVLLAGYGAYLALRRLGEADA